LGISNIFNIYCNYRNQFWKFNKKVLILDIFCLIPFQLIIYHSSML